MAAAQLRLDRAGHVAPQCLLHRSPLFDDLGIVEAQQLVRHLLGDRRQQSEIGGSVNVAGPLWSQAKEGQEFVAASHRHHDLCAEGIESSTVERADGGRVCPPARLAQ